MGSTENFHAALVKAISDGKIRLGVNLVSGNTPGSPFYSWIDNQVPFLAILGIVVYNFYTAGWMIGLLSAICGLIFFLWIVQKWIMKRVERRVREAVLVDPIAFLDAWDRRIVALTVVENEAFATHPDDWREFVREHVLRSPRAREV